MSPSAYEMLGGEPTFVKLVDRFYELMDTDPDCKPIRDMHANDLSESNRKLRLFLIGRFGGPQTYIEERGHPRLRMRHMPFEIGADEARQWMKCMETAIDEVVEHPDHRAELKVFLGGVAQHMRNR